MKLCALTIITLSFVYSVIGTKHFGEHWLPTTDAEVIFAGITCIILSIGLSLYGLATRKP